MPGIDRLTLRFLVQGQHLRPLLIALGCIALAACSSAQRADDTPRSFSEADAREFYQRYQSALQLHRRDTIAQFYHSDGALIIFNGVRERRSNAALDSRYRGRWRGPVFFTFDSLRFEPLRNEQVLVTGGFRWLSAESPDTGHFAYLSILDRTPAGLKIVVEHETPLAVQRR
jgi:hypothetical protein